MRLNLKGHKIFYPRNFISLTKRGGKSGRHPIRESNKLRWPTPNEGDHKGRPYGGPNVGEVVAQLTMLTEVTQER